MTAFCYQFQKYKNWKKHLIEGDTTAKTNNPNFFLWASLMLIWAYFEVRHCMKSVFIRSFSGPYFTVFGLNMEIPTPSIFSPKAGKCGAEKLRIHTLFTQLEFTA